MGIEQDKVKMSESYIKMVKKIIFVLMICFVSLGFAACFSDEGNQTNFRVDFVIDGQATEWFFENIQDGQIISDPGITSQKLGHNFERWFKDDNYTEKWNFATDKVTKNISLYGRHIVQSFIVTFECEGCIVVSGETEIIVSYGQEYVEFPVLERNGYTFNGWGFYEKINNTDTWFPISENFNFWERDWVLYPSWTKDIMVSLDYQGADGNNDLESFLVKRSDIISCPVPTRNGWHFLGWFNKPNDQGIQYTDYLGQALYNRTWLWNLPQGDSIEIVLYAHWVESIGLDGIGTSDRPYLINSKADLLLFADLVSNEPEGILGSVFGGCNFSLTDDIDLDGMEWTPIGGFNRTFHATLHGNGHTIGNFKITKPHRDAGLFGHLRGKVENLGIVNFTIDIVVNNSSTPENYDVINAGALAGYAESLDMSGCWSKGTISIAAWSTSIYNVPTARAGGLIGKAISFSNIQNCYSDVEVTVRSGHTDIASSADEPGLENWAVAGGLIGEISNGGYSLFIFFKVNNCYASGNVTAHALVTFETDKTTAAAGGLVGFASGIYRIENSFAVGHITSSSSYTGTPGDYKDGAFAGGVIGIQDYEDKTTILQLPDDYEGPVGIIENCFRLLDYQLFQINGSYSRPTNEIGASRNHADYNNAEFYIQELGWSNAIWNFSNLNAESYVFPVLA